MKDKLYMMLKARVCFLLLYFLAFPYSCSKNITQHKEDSTTRRYRHRQVAIREQPIVMANARVEDAEKQQANLVKRQQTQLAATTSTSSPPQHVNRTRNF